MKIGIEVNNCWECPYFNVIDCNDGRVTLSYVECSKIKTNSVEDIHELNKQLQPCKDKIYKSCPLNQRKTMNILEYEWVGKNFNDIPGVNLKGALSLINNIINKDIYVFYHTKYDISIVVKRHSDIIIRVYDGNIDPSEPCAIIYKHASVGTSESSVLSMQSKQKGTVEG